MVSVVHVVFSLAIFGTNEAVAALDKFIRDEPWKKAVEPAADSSHGSTVVGGLEGLVAKHLTPVSGAKHIPMYMERLPRMYSLQSTPILDSEGRFDTGSKKIGWPEVASRTQGYFDVLLSGQSSSSYSKAVLHQLSQLHPQKNGALKRLKHFVGQVDLVSAPWLPLC